MYIYIYICIERERFVINYVIIFMLGGSRPYEFASNVKRQILVHVYTCYYSLMNISLIINLNIITLI